MIQLPRRSVTRFFIPLIDVLTLLFCIYLLMPIVKQSGEIHATEPLPNQAPPDKGKTPAPPDDKNKNSLLEKERLELERLRREKIETLQERLAIQVLEIDGSDGKLYFRGPEPFEIASQADALDLIQQHKREANRRALYYLFLYPPKDSGYPEQGQVQNYKRWFQDVAHNLGN